ncbi:hypothetical protein Q8A73_007078 [Channa argus]|nr:hypothetical protein Q8A73_007078 [Channa argus]
MKKIGEQDPRHPLRSLIRVRTPQPTGWSWMKRKGDSRYYDAKDSVYELLYTKQLSQEHNDAPTGKQMNWACGRGQRSRGSVWRISAFYPDGQRPPWGLNPKPPSGSFKGQLVQDFVHAPSHSSLLYKKGECQDLCSFVVLLYIPNLASELWLCSAVIQVEAQQGALCRGGQHDDSSTTASFHHLNVWSLTELAGRKSREEEEETTQMRGMGFKSEDGYAPKQDVKTTGHRETLIKAEDTFHGRWSSDVRECSAAKRSQSGRVAHVEVAVMCYPDPHIVPAIWSGVASSKSMFMGRLQGRDAQLRSPLLQLAAPDIKQSLQILDPEEVEYIRSHAKATVGGSVTLDCGPTRPNIFIWGFTKPGSANNVAVAYNYGQGLKLQSQFSSIGHMQVADNSSALLIEGLQRDAEGMYTCQALYDTDEGARITFYFTRLDVEDD